jgi:bifunctional N-acetylglucosamine-1-phosphate-uridyltransferase/glucosamine-1-phosphate-acetyltransferase GlmU-like protein
MAATDTCLVVLAAGQGTRFGGPKQLVAVRDDGATIMDVLIVRAAAVGIVNAVVVVNPEIEREVRAHLGVSVEVVVQKQRRGTADAVLTAREAAAGPIVVVNADDVYPLSAFAVVAMHLDEHAAVGFRLDRGRIGSRPESRALLECDATGLLTQVREVQIERRAGGSFVVAGESAIVAGDQRVSMNMWAFQPSVFDALDAAVAAKTEGEVFLPDVVAAMVRAGAPVRVVPCDDECVSLTYAEDIAVVRSALQ